MIIIAEMPDRAINPSVRTGFTGDIAVGGGNYQLCDEVTGPAGLEELFTCQPPQLARFVSFHLSPTNVNAILNFHEIEVHGSCSMS